jgi:hypothetical protein
MIITGFLFTLGAIAACYGAPLIFGVAIAALSSRRFWIAIGVVAVIILGLAVWLIALPTIRQQEASALAHAKQEHVEFAMSKLPPGIPDNDKTIIRQELTNYFSGLYDQQHVPDLNLLDRYLASIDPSLVRK